MFDRMIHFALTHRMLITCAAALVTAWGVFVVADMPVDVLPDLNRTTVTVLTECKGLTPEQVETQVTRHIEYAVNGSPGVERVRSDSGIGLSLVFVEFEWGTDPYRARQIVQEKLNLTRESLPKDINPVLGPIASIMGEIMFIGLSSERARQFSELVVRLDDELADAEGRAGESDGERSDLDRRSCAARAARAELEAELIRLRNMADWEIRPRLLAVKGVAKVGAIGGEIQQFQVLADPARLRQYGLTTEDVRKAMEAGNENAAGGFVDVRGIEFQVPVTGRTSKLADIADSVIDVRHGVPVRMRDVAEVRIGPRFKRGTGGMSRVRDDGGLLLSPAVIINIQKQPGVDTVRLTGRIRGECAVLQDALNRNLAGDARVVVHSDLFLQANFINASIHNVAEALRDGSVLVVVTLFLFLLNLRTTAITLTAIPLSFVLTGLLFHLFGFTVNTMTLGGLALAIGELTDDAVVGVENVFRRLRENTARGSPIHPLLVVFRASREIRNSVVLSTLIVMFTFLPVLALPGIEGRLFTPMGLSYVVSLLASLLVSLTVTPVLCYLLLPNAKAVKAEREGFLVRRVKAGTAMLLRFTLRVPVPIMLLTGTLVIASAAAVSMVGVERLPKFNEGTYTIEFLMKPGTSLSESQRIGAVAQRLLHNVPEVISTALRTGRAEVDEHVHGSYFSEIDVDLKPSARSRDEISADLRRELAKIPSAEAELGQPISHRIDHMTSGVRSQIALKIFGDDLELLRSVAARVQAVVAEVPGVIDLRTEPQVPGPEVKVNIRREDAARVGFKAGTLAEALETVLGGNVVGQVVEGQRNYDLVIWTGQESRRDAEAMARTMVTSPTGAQVTLGQIADVFEGTGPNMVKREDGRRRIVVSCNVQGRDLGTTAQEIERVVREKIDPTLPPNFVIRTGGQFEAMIQASRLILALGALAVLASFALLYAHFRSSQVALQILLTIPQCFIGAVVAVMLTSRTSEGADVGGGLIGWLQSRSWNIAHLIGFFSLIGIAARNGVLLIDAYVRLHKEEGMPFGPELIIKGTQDRMIPMAMTTLTAMLSLVPILLAPGTPGKEILYPVAVVVFGGLISTSLIGMLFSPTVFLRFGRKAVERSAAEQTERTGMEDLALVASTH